MSQKKSKSKNIRNVLAAPFNIQWSESNPEGVASLQKALEELLPLAKLERKNLKLHSDGKIIEKTPPVTDPVKNQEKIFRSYLAPGFQSVIRGLEKNELCCVLLSSDISPPMIPRVVCSYCNTHNIPLMIVPELKTITKSSLGFSAMVLGLKEIVGSTANPFFPIYEIVSQNRSTFEIPFDVKPNLEKPSEEMENYTCKYEESCVSFAKSKNVYLYRENTNERVFRPGTGINSSSRIQHSSKPGLDGDFISFSKTETNSLGYERVISKPTKTGRKSDSENDISDCDSVDEDNIFFVDNEPDQMLMDTDPSNNDDDSQANANILRLDGKSLQNQKAEDLTKKNIKKATERYFTDKVKHSEKTKKVKHKGTKSSQNSNDFVKTNKKEGKPKVNSSAFYPMTVKTVIGNPKKIKRKKK